MLTIHISTWHLGFYSNILTPLLHELNFCLIGIHSLETMNIFTKFHGNPFRDYYFNNPAVCSYLVKFNTAVLYHPPSPLGEFLEELDVLLSNNPEDGPPACTSRDFIIQTEKLTSDLLPFFLTHASRHCHKHCPLYFVLFSGLSVLLPLCRLTRPLQLSGCLSQCMQTEPHGWLIVAELNPLVISISNLHT